MQRSLAVGAILLFLLVEMAIWNATSRSVAGAAPQGPRRSAGALADPARDGVRT
jgi:hypothetical protein